MSDFAHQALNQQLLQQNKEKERVDKLLTKEVIEDTRKLIQKDVLTRSELRQIIYLLTSDELKLVALNEWHRYYIIKYGGVWVSLFIKVAELLFDYEDYIKQMDSRAVDQLQAMHPVLSKYKDKELMTDLIAAIENPDIPPRPHLTQQFINEYEKITLSRDARNMFRQAQTLMQHIAKELVILFYMISRSSLSENGMAFTEMLHTNFSGTMKYTGMPGQEEQKDKTLRGRY